MTAIQAQTTGAMSNRGACHMISTNNSDWTDISGVFASIKPSGGDRNTGDIYTASGDTAITTEGKRKPVELNCSIVYSESTLEGFYIIWGYFTADTPIYYRWSPAGGQSGELGYTTDKAIITQCEPPGGGDVGSGEPIVCAFNLKTGKITKAAISADWVTIT